MTDLSSITTHDLVTELRTRAGVDVQIAEPYEDIAVSINGPAIVLVVTD